MIDNFQIYSHPLQDVPANDSRTADFLVTERPFALENRVFSQANGNRDAAPIVFGDLKCTQVIGGNGSENYLMQNDAADATEWLPRYRSSERTVGFYTLSPFERMAFTYDNKTGTDILRLQTSFIGHKVFPERVAGRYLRPYTYYTANVVIAPGVTDTREITIQGDFAFLCRAFVGPVRQAGITVIIRNVATGYSYMNVPTLAENFIHDLAAENNFRPLGFSPFVIPERSTLQVTFTNVGTVEYSGLLGLWGNHHTPVLK